MEKSYVCHVCLKEFSTATLLLNHQKMHMNVRDFTFRCPYQHCEALSFATYNAAAIHLSRVHSQSRHGPAQGGSVTSMQELCQATMKKFDSESEVECPFPDCLKKFSKKTLFQSHLSRYHKNWKKDNLPTSQSSTAPTLEEPTVHDDFPLSDLIVPADDLDRDNSDLEMDGDYSALDLERFVAEFYLMLEGKCSMPVTVVQQISESLTFLSGVVHAQLRKVTLEELKSKNISKEESETIAEKILSHDTLFNTHHKTAPGPSFTSDARRKNLYNHYFTYIPPVEINLSPDPVERDCIQYIPLKKTLEAALENPVVKMEVEKSFSRLKDPNVLQDFYDGSAYQAVRDQSPRASVSSASTQDCCLVTQDAIHLFLYQDGFKIVNPLGSAKHAHEEVNTYLTIGNLPPYLRAKDEHAHLVLVCNKNHFKEYDCEKIYERLLKDLKDLEVNGVNFANRKVPVILQFILGDNLGQHIIGGFEKSFMSVYFCRYFNITKHTFQELPAAVNEFRTPEDFESAVEKIRSGECQKFEGVVDDCVFNSLSHYHCAKPGLPPCFGHDALLGYVDYDLALYIKHFVNEFHWFSYKQLNELISSFCYVGRDLDNKPAPVPENGKRVGGHAVQNWTLLRLLPIIVEDYVLDPLDEIWQLYLELKSLVELISAPAIHINQVDLIGIQCKNYLTHRAHKFSTVNLRPKHHYLAHTQELTKCFGPIINFSTLNFERKHQFFKNVARMSHNFINVEKTLATRHQWAFMFSRLGKVFVKTLKVNKSAPLASVELPPTISSVLEPETLSSYAVTAKGVICDGVIYKEGSWLLLGCSTGSDLYVGQICLIVVDRGEVLFVVTKYSAQCNSRMGFYVVDETKKSCLCFKQHDLQVPVPQSVYVSSYDKKVFSLKHALCNDPSVT